jgi:tetratricopeptide (TPR) repeat protein
MAHYYRALYYISKGSWDEAIKDLEQAREEQALTAAVNHELGRCYYEKKSYNPALEFFEQVDSSQLEDIEQKCHYYYMYAQTNLALGYIKAAYDLLIEILEYDEAYQDTKQLYESIKEKVTQDMYYKFLNAGREEFVALTRALVHNLGYSINQVRITKNSTLEIRAFFKQNAALNINKGTQTTLIEVIRSKINIGELVLRELSSKIKENQADNGLCIATSEFSEEAQSFAKTRSIKLLSGKKLEKLLTKLKI